MFYIYYYYQRLIFSVFPKYLYSCQFNRHYIDFSYEVSIKFFLVFIFLCFFITFTQMCHVDNYITILSKQLALFFVISSNSVLYNMNNFIHWVISVHEHLNHFKSNKWTSENSITTVSVSCFIATIGTRSNALEQQLLIFAKPYTITFYL